MTASMLALSKSQGGIVAAVGAVVLLVAASLILLRGRSDEVKPDIPAAMKPGPSNPDLEGPMLLRLQGWGVLLILFLVIWIPLYFLRQPAVNAAHAEQLRIDSIQRGKDITEPASITNPDGFNCMRCHGPQLTGGPVLYNGNVTTSQNLTTACSLFTLDQIRAAIEQGVPNTAMPSWSVKYQGAMDDQQIQDIINYLLTIQNIPFSQNKCTNPKAGSPTPAPSASPSASPTK